MTEQVTSRWSAKWRWSKMKWLPHNMNPNHILPLVIKIKALLSTADQIFEEEKFVFLTWNSQQRFGKVAFSPSFIDGNGIWRCIGGKRRCSQLQEPDAHRHSCVITPWLLPCPGASQYLSSPVCSKLKKKKKNVPEHIKKAASLPWAVPAGECPPAALLWICLCSAWILVHCQTSDTG